ncbi:kinase inhibitor [Scandinavium goeteborgense]|uniref:kinase inhibitor n=1 Tax=Scandinavium goeteborgense TaxID=1851514 RepID=UPI000F67394B|nr:kinase inhibitor [Scandinavium goeteborgense]QKN82471.1 kinase inhibitor [Scandinavium goeteborgense]
MQRVICKAAGILAIFSFTATAAPVFTLSSTDITNHHSLTPKQVFNGFGCSGENISPQLSWAHAPEGTKSFAITAYDPNAPTGSGWWHWTVVNIPVNIHVIAAGAGDKGQKTLPASAVQGRNDFGYSGFGGACPPEGDRPHPYQFTVWALKTDKLPIDSDTSGAMVGYMLHSNVIAKAELTANYGR